MARVRFPRVQIIRSLRLANSPYDISGQRMYIRKNGKFVAIGWTGDYRFHWKDSEYHDYTILDSELE